MVVGELHAVRTGVAEAFVSCEGESENLDAWVGDADCASDLFEGRTGGDQVIADD